MWVMRKVYLGRFTELAGRLKAVRLKQGRSLRDVARDMGVNASMVRAWELGMNVPSGAYFIAWAQALGFYVDITDAEEEKA